MSAKKRNNNKTTYANDRHWVKMEMRKEDAMKRRYDEEGKIRIRREEKGGGYDSFVID